MTALIGRMIEPVYMKSRSKTLRAIQPKAQGKVREIPLCVSVYSAAVPPTYVFNEVGIARTDSICFCASLVRGLIDEIAEIRASFPTTCGAETETILLTFARSVE